MSNYFIRQVVDKHKSLVYVTQNPMECYGNQTAYLVYGDGSNLVLSANSKSCFRIYVRKNR